MTEPVVTYADDFESHPKPTYQTVPVIATKVVKAKDSTPVVEATVEAETK
jgi:hypothetical protein